MLSVVLVPVIKDKAGEISSIGLASVFSKLIEIIILDRIEMYTDTNPNQFGFKKKHGTDQCIYVLKEVTNLYRSLNGSVFECFLESNKAFDRVNHRTLFKKLSERGDDLILISSSSPGLCQLLYEFEKFLISHDVKFNAKKECYHDFQIKNLERVYYS